MRRFAWGVCVLVAPWTDVGCSCAIRGQRGCAMEWSTALVSNVVTIVRRSTVSFDAGMCALLRLALAGMRGLGNLLNVEADRLERDMSALEHFGRVCIFFIMLHAIAAILCAMGRSLHGFGALLRSLGVYMLTADPSLTVMERRAYRRIFRRGRSPIPVWIVVIMLVGALHETVAWSAGGASAPWETQRVNHDVREGPGGVYAMRAVWDRWTSFWWNRDDVEEARIYRELRSRQTSPRRYYPDECDTFKCHFFAIQDQALNLLYSTLTRPGRVIAGISWFFRVLYRHGFPFWPEVVGVGILWMLVNAMSEVWLRFGEVLGAVFGVGRWFMRAPVFKLLARLTPSTTKEDDDSGDGKKKKKDKKKEKKEGEGGSAVVAAVTTSDSKGEKEQAKVQESKSGSKGKKSEKKNKKGKGTEGETAKVGSQSAGKPRTESDIEGSKLLGMFEQVLKKAVQQPSGAVVVRQKAGSGRTNLWCDFCESHTHTTDTCYNKQRADRFYAKEKEKQKQKEKENEKGQDKAGPSTSNDGQTVKVSQIEGDGDKVQLLYTPADIGGHAFRKCMIDTGSEVNVLPMKEAVRFGIAYDPCAITQILGFNGSASPVDGMASCRLKVEPCEKEVEAQFLVTSGLSGGPILGFPALESLGLTVSCTERELVCANSGKVVRCSAAAKPRKN